MSSRYESLKARGNLDEASELDEGRGVSVASENSHEAAQHDPEGDVSSEHEDFDDSAQHHEDQDICSTSPSSLKGRLRPGQPATITRRIGKLPLTILLLGFLGTAAFVVYITFLWFSASQNTTWKKIALSDWITRSIAIAAVVLRTATTAQAGVASSMLAAVALESTIGVPLPELGPLSLMRASSAAPYTLLLHSQFVQNSLHWLLAALSVILTVTTVTLQFTSTILLTDVNSGFIARDLVPYTYYVPPDRGSLKNNWMISPSSWPVFAEYAGTNASNGSLGYSDTGVSMRALLPISDAQSRSMIHTYKGIAPVIDARTICVRPNITHVWIEDSWLDNAVALTVHGNISFPDDLRPILSAATPLRSFTPTSFACEGSNGQKIDYFRYLGPDETQNWDLTICDFGYDSRVVRASSFFLTETRPATGFLLMNYTGHNKTGRNYEEGNFLPLELASFNDSTPGLHYHNNNEWLDLKQDVGTVVGTRHKLNFSDTKLSFSLCIPIFDAQKLTVSASSQAPLKEATYSYDVERKQYRYDKVRKQLLWSPDKSPEERGVLSLQPKSWLLQADPGSNRTNPLNPFDYPFSPIEGVVHISYIDDWQTSETRNHPTVHLLDAATGSSIRLNRNIAELGLEVLQEGGTVAEAMQSMLMTAVLADYQQYIISRVGPGSLYSEDYVLSDFVPTQVPRGNGRPANNPAGASRSYVVVMLATAIHSIVVGIIVVLFIKGTKNTLLWQSWHAVAQCISTVSEPYLRQANTATDSEVSKQMEMDGTSDQPVSLRDDEHVQRYESRNSLGSQEAKSFTVLRVLLSDTSMEELQSLRNVDRETLGGVRRISESDAE